jgi:hypothetical protein
MTQRSVIIMAKLQSDLANVLILLFEYPGAPRVLTGEFQAPGVDRLVSIGEKKRKTIIRKLMRGAVSMTLADVISDTIDSAGGWPDIIKASRGWIRNNRDKWKILAEYFVWVKGHEQEKLDGDLLEKTAKKHGISGSDLKRLWNDFPGELAEAVIRYGEG